MNIIGKSECTALQMAQYLINKNPNAKSWALEYAQLYLEEGEVEGVRGDGAWIQSCKETGNFKFNGGTAVTFDQNNFCGLGVTSKGMKGHSFSTPRLGIRAQIQHLKGYATSIPLVNSCIDPRYKYINPKGKAPRFEDLAGKWAVPGYDTAKASSLEDAMNKGIGYGFDIIAGVEQMKKLVKYNNTNGLNNKEESMGYSNSSLVSYTKISPNKTSPRNHVIDTIIIHCYVGQVTAERGCNGSRFINYDPKKGASCNYVVGCDGSIGLCVEEKDRSWCSSNKPNDHRAITIEVASDTTHPYAVTDKALDSLIKLCADVCKRNNIKKLVWSTNKNDRVNHLNGCNMTVHRDFANKSCPGDYLYNKHGYIADEVNKLLGSYNGNNSSENIASTATTYTVVKGDTLSKIGAKTGIAWKTIANLNGIKSPYNISVGQVLKLTNKTNSTSSTNISSNTKYMYNGLDYSPVFNPTYYANKYNDLEKAFGNNSAKLFNHFKSYGMKEGRQASSEFDVNIYKNRYVDLQKAFGNNMTEYYKHYLQFGRKEGRKAI